MIGGFTGQAKSAFAEQVALWTSISGCPTLYLTYELGEDLTRLRMGAKIARTSIGSFNRGGLDLITKQELAARDLDIFQPKKRSIDMLEAIVRRGKHQLVIIDDCRNIDGVMMSAGGSDAHNIAARITELAQRYGVHILALQQLDPKSYRLGPNEWRFQDSTAFEQRAFNSLTVFRPFKHRGLREDKVAEIRIRKNRWGPSAKVHYRWSGETMTFWEFSPEELEQLQCCKPKAKATS